MSLYYSSFVKSNFLLQRKSNRGKKTKNKITNRPVDEMCCYVYRVIIPEHEPFFDLLRNAPRSYQCNDDTAKMFEIADVI